MDEITEYLDSEFLIFYNPKQDAYNIETREENRRKPPMGEGWRVVARANGWLAACALVEQRRREGADV